MKKKKFDPALLAALDKNARVWIRAGSTHRFISIWAVVVQGRVFVRSWSLKPRSWYRTFLEEPQGAIRVGDQEIPVRAVHTRSEMLKDRIDKAYLEKYNSPGSIQYARDLGRKKSRDATIELLPLK
jgi:hypothetical protein